MSVWWQQACRLPDAAAADAARARQQQLTKPPGSLGELEALAIRLAGLQACATPAVDRAWITVFAADHGVAAEGVSAFPQSVTAAMIRNFVTGGAAISVLAKVQGARLEVVNLGTVGGECIAGSLHQPLGAGAANITHSAAMTVNQCEQALRAGFDAVERALAEGMQLFIGGEMGIANTTSATALACALLGESPTSLAGPGTGLNAEGVARKTAVIQRALERHADCHDAADWLRCLGGFEIAALAGAYVHAARRGLPVLVDGFISTVAALVAVRLNAGVRDWLLFAHASAEPGHARLLQALEATPILNLGLRLGEGSGAAVALPLLRLACELHAGMASFAEAGVATGPSA